MWTNDAFKMVLFLFGKAKCSDWTYPSYVAEDALELLVVLSPPPTCWNNCCEPTINSLLKLSFVAVCLEMVHIFLTLYGVKGVITSCLQSFTRLWMRFIFSFYTHSVLNFVPSICGWGEDLVCNFVSSTKSIKGGFVAEEIVVTVFLYYKNNSAEQKGPEEDRKGN